MQQYMEDADKIKQNIKEMDEKLAEKGETNGELSKSDAESKKSSYIESLKNLKKEVREDFTEMDFENADQRTEVEKQIEIMESAYDDGVKLLESMSFE